MFENVCQRHGVDGYATLRERGIERVTGGPHTTIMAWVKRVGQNLPDAYAPEPIPEVGELDELETFIRSKKTKSGSGRRLTTCGRGSSVGW